MNIPSLLPVCLALVMAGCATNKPMIPPPLDLPQKVLEHSTLQGSGTRDVALATEVKETPKPPPASKTETIKPSSIPSASAEKEVANISLAFEQIPLPTFIQLVYGTTLKKTVNVDPAVASRQDLLTIRTGAPQTPSQVADAAKLLLKSYGIAVVDLGSLVRIVPDNTNLGYLPEIRRGRALPETPLPLRPIFQLVELQAVRNTDVAAWIRTMFGDKVSLHEDPGRNAVWLSGQSENVTAALEAIHVLDQPTMRGRQSVRLTPAYMSADELAKRLAEILQAEGYATALSSVSNAAISLVPIPTVNAVIVFAADRAVVDHVVTWARNLDQPGTQGVGKSFFSYQVQYVDAQTLATTLEKVLSGQAVKPVAGTVAAAAGARVVVDQGSNTLIFQGSTEDYGQIKSLLEMLDRPSKQALIEVTVAEVRLTGNLQYGVDQWLLNNGHLGGAARTETKLGSGGLTFTRFDSLGAARLILNVLASDNRATILSSPRVVSRNGETATIQVGQEVPIVTSQITTQVTGTAPSVQNQVQYRNSGVILRVRPVIHSGNRIDLDVSQEVSEPSVTNTGVSNSPTFGTKRIETKLSMKDGATVLLGGLISSNGSQGTAGLPLLKDVPVLGGLFGTNTSSNERRELIILITPYVISSDSDAQAVTDAFKKQLGGWAQTIPPAKPPIPESRTNGKDNLPVKPAAQSKPQPAKAPVAAQQPAPPAPDAKEKPGATNQNATPGKNDGQQK